MLSVGSQALAHPIAMQLEPEVLMEQVEPTGFLAALEDLEFFRLRSFMTDWNESDFMTIHSIHHV